MTIPNLTATGTRRIILVLAITFFVQGYLGLRDKSLTWDEPVFIASGYTYLTRNDFRLNPEAPPLMQQLVAFPLLFLDLNVPSEDHISWQGADHFGFARAFLDLNAPKIRTIATLARLPILILGALFIYLFGSWGVRIFAPWPTVGATTLATVSPNLLAHARLATTDFGCTVLMFAAVYTFWFALAEKRRITWALCGTVTGLALLAKFTSLLLGPIFILLSLLHVIRNGKKAASVLQGLVIVGGVCVLVVGAGYNLTFNPLLYLDGLRKVYTTGASGYQYYLFGEASEKPWWYYHLVVFALKTPVSVLLLVVLAIGGIFIQKENRLNTGILAVPAILMLLVSCFDQTNLGFRRILPAVPFLLLLTGHVPKILPSRSSKWVYAALVLITVLSSILVHPHYLSYFNQIAGGPDRGPLLLDDSNIDWGQDLPALARWQAENQDASQLKLMYFGNVRPEHYGVRALPIPEQDILNPRPGFYAISAHNLAWLRKIKQRTGQDIDWLSKYEPVSRVGFSIYLYNFPGRP